MEKEKKRNNLYIAEYKLIFEKFDLISEEYKEGSIDITYRLSYFRDKIKKNNEAQIKSFDAIINKKTNKAQTNKIKKSLTGINKEKSNTKKQKPKWVKELYKKIVMVTHPDKIDKLPNSMFSKSLIEKYMLTVDSYNNGMYENLIMIGSDLGFNIEKSIIKEILEPAILSKKTNINHITATLGYAWYHIEESQREEKFKEFLKELGYKFTNEEVKEVISKVRKSERKPGYRPANRRKNILK